MNHRIDKVTIKDRSFGFKATFFSGLFLLILLTYTSVSAKNVRCRSQQTLDKYAPATVFRDVKIPNHFMARMTFFHVADDYLSAKGKGLPGVECSKFKPWLMPQDYVSVISTKGVRGVFRPFYRLVDSVYCLLTWPSRFYQSMMIDHPVTWEGVRIIVIDSAVSGTNAFDYFFDVWMPKIRSPFIIMNFGDLGVPYDIMHTKTNYLPSFAMTDARRSFAMTNVEKKRINSVLDNPYLVAWYVLNFDGSISHPKIRRFPIGKYDPLNLAKSFNEKSPKTSDRKFKIYSDVSLTNSSKRMKFYGLKNRAEIHDEIKDNPYFDFQQGWIDQKLQWQKRTEYMFSISLVGNGFDCHRTWESLYLGNIVLLQSSPLDPLFEGLPVVIVKDWSEINEANLKKWAAKYHDASTNPKYREKLTSVYWLKMLEADIQAGEKKFNTYRPSYAKKLPR